MTGSRHYRSDVLCYFTLTQAKSMLLDGQVVTEIDLRKAKERSKEHAPRDAVKYL